MIVKFKKCTRAILHEMVESFYEEPIEIPDDPTLEYKWTPAEVNQILFRNFGKPQDAVAELTSLTRDDMYGFMENGCVESNGHIPSLFQNDTSTN